MYKEGTMCRFWIQGLTARFPYRAPSLSRRNKGLLRSGEKEQGRAVPVS